VVDDVNVLVITSAGISIYVNLYALRDHLAATGIIITRRGGFSAGGRRREIIADGAVRLDAVATNGLDGFAFGRKFELG
jgi:hypothetical protein